MCGINGIIVKENTSNQSFVPALKKMNKALAHRGPDADGVWNDDVVFLGHRRLSIIDLSDAGNQPLHSSDGRYVIVYNGELYNYKELKFELQRAVQGTSERPYIFATNTDTEVIIAAYARWGKDCVSRFNGMFAFALWDKQDKSLFIARDRLGIKPLYYSIADKRLVFSSEIRALLESGEVPRKLSYEGLVDYLRYLTVNAPVTMVEGVKMLMPGHTAVWKDGSFEINKYWNLKENINYSSKDKDYKQICTDIRDLFFKSVERRLIADVPFGAFLSGGIDSSIVVAAMSKVSQTQVKTFSVVFDESEFSEAKYANLVAKQYNTEHQEILLRPEDFLADLPNALAAFDHPSGDGTNTYTVSKATKKAGITMALSGLGGDELFCGYETFKRNYALEKKYWLNLIPRVFRSAGGEIYKVKNKSIAADKIAELLAKPSVNFEYAYPISRQVLSDSQISGLLNKFDLPLNSVYKFVRLMDYTDGKRILTKYSIAEISTYMQNVLLRDTDQMSMASALEVRVPFLDYTLVEYALGVEDKYRYPHTQKKLLTDSLGDLIPKEIIEKPKQGFDIPFKNWMKNELKSFCEENLKHLSELNCFNQHAVTALWNRFLSNDPKITWARIWILVVLGHWIKKNEITE